MYYLLGCFAFNLVFIILKMHNTFYCFYTDPENVFNFTDNEAMITKARQLLHEGVK